MAIFIDGYQIDAAREENVFLRAEVTEYPVEESADVTDHVRPVPLEVLLVGVVSDHPIRPLADTRSIVDRPSEEFLSRLELIHEFRDPIIIETSRRVYENMILFDLQLPRTARTGESLEFSARFRQVEFISTSLVTINVEFERAKARKSLGARNALATPTQAPSPPPEALTRLGI